MQDDPPKTTATTSWLVRCWVEPREEGCGAEEPVVRCYVRDLRTGRERYLSDPRALGELVLRSLRAEATAGSRSGEAESRDLRSGG